MKNRFIIPINSQIRYLFQSYTRIVLIKVYEPPAHPTRGKSRWAPRKHSSFPSPASFVINNTHKGIPPVRKRLRALPYAKLYNGISFQLVN